MKAVAAAPFGTVALHGSAAGDMVAYGSYGPEDAPAVFVLGGISAHRFVFACGPWHPKMFPEVLGDKLRLIPPHCDPTVNLHDWLVCVRGEVVVDLWPVSGRGPGL